jgi:pimeloyl-ACP methyl ester carboxylesterase
LRWRTTTIAGVRLHYWIGGDRNGKPVVLWHGFLSTSYAWREVAPALAEGGMAVLIPDMRGYGDSDKPVGTDGYDARSLAEECRAVAAAIGFGGGKPLIHAAHHMGALPALIWSADHAQEVAGLLYIEAPVMLGPVLRQVLSYTPESMAQGSMWWWILPLALGVPERLVVDEYLRSFAGTEGVLGSVGIYRAAFRSIDQILKLSARVACRARGARHHRRLPAAQSHPLNRLPHQSVKPD